VNALLACAGCSLRCGVAWAMQVLAAQVGEGKATEVVDALLARRPGLAQQLQGRPPQVCPRPASCCGHQEPFVLPVKPLPVRVCCRAWRLPASCLDWARAQGLESVADNGGCSNCRAAAPTCCPAWEMCSTRRGTLLPGPRHPTAMHSPARPGPCSMGTTLGRPRRCSHLLWPPRSSNRHRPRSPGRPMPPHPLVHRGATQCLVGLLFCCRLPGATKWFLA
jgi:hypothetical protein